MSFCIGCLVSAVSAGGIWGFGKLNEWHAERARRRAIAELDRTTPCRGRGGEACEIGIRDAEPAGAPERA